jgi:Uma2 family endonuclease
MAVRPERKLTYDDYVDFPESERWELIDGEAYVVPAPNTKHQRVLIRLLTDLTIHLRAYGGGEVLAAPYDVVLSQYDVLQPDIVFVSDADSRVITEANIWGTPTWAIEVLSPSHPERDRKLKLARYERFGVPEYWIVDPITDRVEIYRLEGDAYGPALVVSPPDAASPIQPARFAVDLGVLFTE